MTREQVEAVVVESRGLIEAHESRADGRSFATQSEELAVARLHVACLLAFVSPSVKPDVSEALTGGQA